MGREGLDRGFHLGPRLVVGDEGDEGEWLVDGLGGTAPPPAAAAAVLLLGRHGVRGGLGDGIPCFVAHLRLHRLGRPLAGPHCHAALRPAHRRARREDPADALHRFATDQPPFVEQPAILAMELLEGVVGQHGGLGPVGDAQQEAVTPADGAGRRRDDLAGVLRLLEGGPLRLVDPVGERGVDHHDDLVVGVLGQPRPHRLVELGEARQRTTLGCDV